MAKIVFWFPEYVVSRMNGSIDLPVSLIWWMQSLNVFKPVYVDYKSHMAGSWVVINSQRYNFTGHPDGEEAAVTEILRHVATEKRLTVSKKDVWEAIFLFEYKRLTTGGSTIKGRWLFEAAKHYLLSSQ